MALAYLFVMLYFCPLCEWQWGFWAHRQIHRQAVYLVPAPAADFFRANAQELIDRSVDADNRRRTDPSEAPQHYIDLDRYGAYPFDELPRNYDDALKKFGYERLKENGLVPWRIAAFADSLTNAFREQNREKIIYFAANLGHYVADANVPLHATENYDGQLTGQKGLHARWESVYPQKFMLPRESEYLRDGSIYLIDDPTQEAFKWSLESFLLSQQVLVMDKQIQSELSQEDLYEPSAENSPSSRREFSQIYYDKLKQKLNQMVEKRFDLSVIRVASIWYYSWLKAGEPNLSNILKK
ncbi:MAG: zinc dependent phospholipase C family protein [Chloroherpetonaceae bacterium]